MVDLDQMLRVRMSREERAMLNEVAERRGLTASEWVRQAIHESYRPPRALTPEELAVLALLDERPRTAQQVAQGLVQLKFYQTTQVIGFEEFALAAMRTEGLIALDSSGARYEITPRGRAALKDSTPTKKGGK